LSLVAAKRPPDPGRVRDYTAEYRDEQDPTAGWLEDCCRLDPDAVTAVGELRESYERWAKTNGENVIAARTFGGLLKRRGFADDRLTGGVRARRGITIRSDA
jgi:putative DNA primase/helicase